MIVPDLWARVTLFDAQHRVIAQLGDAGVDSWKNIRKAPRELFTPANSSGRTAPASITTATSTSSNGSTSDE